MICPVFYERRDFIIGSSQINHQRAWKARPHKDIFHICIGANWG